MASPSRQEETKAEATPPTFHGLRDLAAFTDDDDEQGLEEAPAQSATTTKSENQEPTHLDQQDNECFDIIDVDGVEYVTNTYLGNETAGRKGLGKGSIKKYGIALGYFLAPVSDELNAKIRITRREKAKGRGRLTSPDFFYPKADADMVIAKFKQSGLSPVKFKELFGTNSKNANNDSELTQQELKEMKQELAKLKPRMNKGLFGKLFRD